MKTIKSSVKYLSTFRGVTGIPLSDVVREQLLPLASTDDLTTNFRTSDEEIIWRATIIDVQALHGGVQALEDGPFKATYLINQVKVWEKILPLFIQTKAYTYLKVAR